MLSDKARFDPAPAFENVAHIYCYPQRPHATPCLGSQHRRVQPNAMGPTPNSRLSPWQPAAITIRQGAGYQPPGLLGHSRHSALSLAIPEGTGQAGAANPVQRTGEVSCGASHPEVFCTRSKGESPAENGRESSPCAHVAHALGMKTAEPISNGHDTWI